MRKTILCLVVIVALGLVLTPMLSSAGPPPGQPPCDKAGPQAHNKNCDADTGGPRCEHGKQPKKGCPEGDGTTEPTGTCTNADLAILGTLNMGAGPNLICLYGPDNTADPNAPGECPDGTVLGKTGGAITFLC